MNFQQFKRVLLSFADAPADIDLGKGRLLVQVGGDVLEATMANRAGGIFVTEFDREQSAEQWLVSRVARLTTLADRILEFVDAQTNFVEPRGRLTDELDRCPDETGVAVPTSLDTLHELLSRHPAGCCWVVYLTSDAGEGKTTLINELARRQALAYKNRQADWLLLPISLAGRPFLRLDDVITGTLVNRFRFPMYFDALLELARMGMVIPALDGFEEMFVEGVAGDAVSALGNLLSLLDSEGSVLIAARKALFEYRALETQSKLLDSLSSYSVAFARLSIDRWGKNEFVKYAEACGVADGTRLHDLIAERLGTADHPLITRAVLVRRLVQLVLDCSDLDDLIGQLDQSANYFARFVATFIEREVQEKWIDRSGSPARPLLQIGEHHDLLAMVAVEMWRTSSAVLKTDVLETIADLYCEEQNKPIAIARQIRERISNHALLQNRDGKRAIGFDHEEFYHYFLGWGLADLLLQKRSDQARIVLNVGPLPDIAADAVLSIVAARTSDYCTLIDMLMRICAPDGPTSYIRENCGRLVAKLLGDERAKSTRIADLTFPTNVLDHKRLEDVAFTNCYFQPTELVGTSLSDCTFTRCEFDRLELSTGLIIADVVMDRCRVRSVVPTTSGIPLYEPRAIEAALVRAGFTLQDVTVVEDIPYGEEADDDARLVERVLRAFYRATEVNEGVLRQKSGHRANHFTDTLLPQLTSAGVLVEVTYRGGGVQRRYKMGLPMSELIEIRRETGGKFRDLVDALKERRNEG